MIYENKNSGFTLVELVMVIIIIGIISLVGSSLLINLIRNCVYIPNKINMDTIATEAMDVLIEGDKRAKGLRSSKSLIKARKNRIEFINQDDQEVWYRYRNNRNLLERCIIDEFGDCDWENIVPYSSGVTIEREGGRFFTYINAKGKTVNNKPNKVKLIYMTLSAKTGSGSFDDWEAQSKQSSGVYIINN